MPKQKIKRIYIRHVLRGNRKTCPSCKSLLFGYKIYSVGFYYNAKWHKAHDDFCICCYDKLVNFISEYEKLNPEKFVEIVGYQSEPIPTVLLYKRTVSYFKNNLKFKLIRSDSDSSMFEISNIGIDVKKPFYYMDRLPYLIFNKGEVGNNFTVELRLTEQSGLLEINNIIDKIKEVSKILDIKEN